VLHRVRQARARHLDDNDLRLSDDAIGHVQTMRPSVSPVFVGKAICSPLPISARTCVKLFEKWEFFDDCEQATER
jgi:hypothetical protein